MTQRAEWRSLSVLIVAFALGIGVSLAEGAASEPTIYRLDPGSEDGFTCTDTKICVCPARPFFPIRGTFTLDQTGADDQFTYYAVSDFEVILVDADVSYRTTGSGQYKIGVESNPLQQMDLDLVRSGGQVVHYSSGLAPVIARFPEIVIAVAAGGGCVAPTYYLQAQPVPTEQIRPFMLLDESRFVRQCVEPCRLDDSRPLLGTFVLVPLQQDAPTSGLPSTAYGVVRLEWRVERTNGPDLRVGGLGVYLQLGGAEPRQLFSLDLNVGKWPPARFESGFDLGGADLSRLDAVLFENSVAAVDALVRLHAAAFAAP